MYKLEKNHYLSHFKNYFTGNLIVKILALFTLPVISNLLTPEDYGFFSLFLVYVSYAALLFTFNLLPAISRFWYDNIDKKIFIGTSIISSSFIFMVFVSFSMIFQELLYRTLEIDYRILILLLIFILIHSIDSVFRQIFVALRKSKIISSLAVIYAILLFLFTLFYIHYADKKFSLIYANLTVGVLFSLVYIYYIKEYIKLEFNKVYLKQNIKYSLPLIFDTISAMLIINIDKIMLEHYLGLKVLGLYSFAYSIGLLLSSVIVFPLLNAWTPNYFEDMNNKDYAKLDKDIFSMIKIVIMVSILMIIFYSELVYLLFNVSYYEGFIILPYIVMSSVALFLWQIYGRSIGYAKKNIYMVFVTLSAGVLNISLNYIFILKYGMIAASISTLASYFLMAILGYLISRYILKMYVFDFKKLFLPVLLLCVALFFSFSNSIISFELTMVLQKSMLVTLLLSVLYHRELYTMLITFSKDDNVKS